MSPIILAGLRHDFYPCPSKFFCGLAHIVHQKAYHRPSVEVHIIWRLRTEDLDFSPTRQTETGALMALVNYIHSEQLLKKGH